MRYLILQYVKIMNTACQLSLNKQVKSVLRNGGLMFGQEVDDQFRDLVDDLVVMSERDTELAEGMRWIDAQSRKHGITFYEMALVILRKHLAERRAKDWLRNKMAAS